MKTRRSRTRASGGKPRRTAHPARRTADPFAAREAERYASPLPSREFILQTLEAEAVPVDEQHLAKLVGVARGALETFGRRLAAMERDGQILRNRKGAILVAQRVAVVRGRVEAHPDGHGFVVPDGGGESFYLPPGRDAAGDARRPRARAAGRARPPRATRGADRRGPGARAQARRRAPERGARRRVRGRDRSAHPARHPDRAGRDRTRQARPGRHRRDRRAAGRARSAHRPDRRGPRRGRRPRNGDRDRAAQARPAVRVLARSDAARGAPSGGGARGGRQGPPRPPRARFRDDRRRDREGLRRRGFLRGDGEGVPAAGRDRRRRPLRPPGRRARLGGPRARQLGLLPAPRDPDAAGEALERAVLAQPERRSAGNGLRTWRSRRAGRSSATSSIRPPYARRPGSPTRRWRARSTRSRRRSDRRSRRCSRASRCSIRCSARCSPRAAGAARSISRRSRPRSTSTRRARSRGSGRHRGTTPTA